MSHVAVVSCKWRVERLAYEAATLGFRIRGTNEMCSKRAMMDCTDLARTHLNPNPLLLFLLQAHVVTAFEQSLSNMTNRLQQLTATAERKDGELTDMRQTIELLRKQSIQAGLTTAHMQSMGVQTQGQGTGLQPGQPGSDQKPPASGAQRTNNNNGTLTLGMQRQHSTDSMCSLNSISSGCSAAQDKNKANKKKGWLRSSFTKAFSRNAKIAKTSRHVNFSNGTHQLDADIYICG